MQHSNGTSNVGRTKVPASVPLSDPLEPQTVPSQMTLSQGIASSLRRSGTSNTTTVLAPAPSSTSPRRPDPASRQTTQSSMAPTSATPDDARGGGSTGIHTRAPGTPFDTHSDELDGVHSRAVEIPPTPEHQSYEGTWADPLKQPSITSDELPSEEMEPSYGSYSSTTPKQATDSQPSTDSPEEPSDTLNEELQEVELDDLTTDDIIIASLVG
ncbi:hypothetical protein EDC04DRAFT_696544 [Pisolithus marmoratus]|nr:hypothetical protein EDC04DRAFT_696544 [Pisolithus marmoratus]